MDTQEQENAYSRSDPVSDIDPNSHPMAYLEPISRPPVVPSESSSHTYDYINEADIYTLDVTSGGRDQGRYITPGFRRQ